MMDMLLLIISSVIKSMYFISLVVLVTGFIFGGALYIWRHRPK